MPFDVVVVVAWTVVLVVVVVALVVLVLVSVLVVAVVVVVPQGPITTHGCPLPAGPLLVEGLFPCVQ